MAPRYAHRLWRTGSQGWPQTPIRRGRHRTHRSDLQRQYQHKKSGGRRRHQVSDRKPGSLEEGMKRMTEDNGMNLQDCQSGPYGVLGCSTADLPSTRKKITSANKMTVGAPSMTCTQEKRRRRGEGAQKGTSGLVRPLSSRSSVA
jgi:hypothetical protein